MILLLGLAAWAAEPSTLQRISELSWSRADALNLAAQIPGSDPETRAAAARALGRLRSTDALVVLDDLRSDPDLSVQIAVADALGWTPGGEVVVRRWLAELGTPGLDRTGAASMRYGALVRALGERGAQQDVPILIGALREPWPVGAIAARAVGTLAARGIAGSSDALPALISRLRGPDPRIVADVAWAVGAVGLSDAGPAELGVVWARLQRGTTPTVQARLLRAIWPHLSPEARDELFLEAATDTSREVRVAVLSSLRPGDVPGDVVGTFLADPDPWIRYATLSALSRDASPEASSVLTRHAREADAWEAAEALSALGLSVESRALDPQQPPPVRAALVALLGELPLLIHLAIDDGEPMVRAAAAQAVLDHPDAAVAEGRSLLSADDPTVRRIGVRLIARGSPSTVAGILLPHLRAEVHHAVQAEALEALIRIAGDGVIPKDRVLQTLLMRAGSSPSGPTRRAGGALADAVGVPWQPPPAPDQIEVPLVRGGSATVASGPPDVSRVRRIRGARITTDQGVFLVELEPDVAPLAVATFAGLAKVGFYDQQVFFEVEPGAYAKTGCPRGDGTGGPGFSVPLEISSLPFKAGTVGLVRSPGADVGGSQWFVATGDLPQQTGNSTRFGRVVQGMYVVERLQPGSRILSVQIERLPEPAPSGASPGPGPGAPR